MKSMNAVANFSHTGLDPIPYFLSLSLLGCSRKSSCASCGAAERAFKTACALAGWQLPKRWLPRGQNFAHAASRFRKQKVGAELDFDLWPFLAY
jgi:hypothetical protein